MLQNLNSACKKVGKSSKTLAEKKRGRKWREKNEILKLELVEVHMYPKNLREKVVDRHSGSS